MKATRSVFCVYLHIAFVCFLLIFYRTSSIFTSNWLLQAPTKGKRPAAGGARASPTTKQRKGRKGKGPTQSEDEDPEGGKGHQFNPADWGEVMEWLKVGDRHLYFQHQNIPPVGKGKHRDYYYMKLRDHMIRVSNGKFKDLTVKSLKWRWNNRMRKFKMVVMSDGPKKTGDGLTEELMAAGVVDMVAFYESKVPHFDIMWELYHDKLNVTPAAEFDSCKFLNTNNPFPTESDCDDDDLDDETENNSGNVFSFFFPAYFQVTCCSSVSLCM
jgi:hypothetical protein